MSSAWGQLTLHRYRSQNHVDALTLGRTATLSQMLWTRRKNPNCVDRLLIHTDRKPNRPILESSKSKTSIGCSFGVLPTVNLVSSPNVERKTGSLTVNEVESSRERTPEYCTTSNSGRFRGGVRARKQRSEGGHYRPFWWDSLFGFVLSFFFVAAPKWRRGRGSQNNVQPLVSPWSWDYTLLLPEDIGAVWRSFSHTRWVSPAAFTYEPQGSDHINIPWLRRC